MPPLIDGDKHYTQVCKALVILINYCLLNSKKTLYFSTLISIFNVSPAKYYWHRPIT